MGLKAERFIDQSVLSSFKCVFCGDILEDAVLLSCDDFCCAGCLPAEPEAICPRCDQPNTGTKEPPRVFHSFYSDLKLHCLFEPLCDTVLPMANLAAHQKDCPHNPVNIIHCEKFCGIRLTQDMLDTHNCGAYFYEQINALQSRIHRLEVDLAELKTAPPKPTVQQNGALTRQSSSSSVASISSKPSTSKFLPKTSRPPPGELGQIGSLLQRMVDTFRDLPGKREYNPDQIWKDDMLCKLMSKMVTNAELKELIASLDIRTIYERKDYNTAVMLPLNNPSLKLILSLVGLDYLLNAGAIRNKKVLIIGIADYTILPYYAHFCSKVVAVVNEFVKDRYDRKFSTHMPQQTENVVFEPYFNDMNGYLRKFDVRPNSFDVIVAQDIYSNEQSKFYLYECCRHGFMLNLAKKQSFEKRSLKQRHPNGTFQQEFEVIETGENVRHILHGIE